LEITLKKESKDFQNKNLKYELSALLDADSFFYGLFDYGSKLAYSDRISSIDDLSSEPWNERISLRKTKIGLLNNLVTLIPESEFRAADMTSIIATSIGISDTSQYILRSDRSEKHNLRICYAVPKGLVKTITNLLDSPILHHYVSTFLDSISDVKEDGIYLDFSGEVLIVIALKGGKPLLVNTYKVTEDLDAFYWIALAHQSIFKEDKSAPIYFSGKLIGETTLYTTLKSYFPQLRKLKHAITLDGISIAEEEALYPLHSISAI